MNYLTLALFGILLLGGLELESNFERYISSKDLVEICSQDGGILESESTFYGNKYSCGKDIVIWEKCHKYSSSGHCIESSGYEKFDIIWTKKVVI